MNSSALVLRTRQLHLQHVYTKDDIVGGSQVAPGQHFAWHSARAKLLHCAVAVRDVEHLLTPALSYEKVNVSTSSFLSTFPRQISLGALTHPLSAGHSPTGRLLPSTVLPALVANASGMAVSVAR